MANASDRRAFGVLQKLLFLPAEQGDQICLIQLVPRTEVRFAGVSGELVPRAYQLAVVAAEYPVAHGSAQLLGNGALELDGQIGDTATRIQDMGADKGIGGAAAQAGAATAAVVAGEGFVHRQRQVGVQLAEKEIAAGLRV